MARIPMITRTITTTEVTVMGINTELGESITATFTIPRTYKDDASMLKMVQKLHDTNTEKYVKVLTSKTDETLYGMSEAQFVELAEVLPPRAVAENTEF